MIPVPLITRANQVPAMVFGYLAFSVVYLGSAALQWTEPTTLTPSVFDAWIPTFYWSVWIYLSQFLLLPFAITSTRDNLDRSHTLYAMLIATGMAALVFLAWPTQVARLLPPDKTLTGLVWSLLYFADAPVNCFPSLHVALAVIAGRGLWRSGSRVMAISWPGFIAISTLTTRQHVTWDIAGGLALAALAIWLSPRILRLEHTELTHGPAGA